MIFLIKKKSFSSSLTLAIFCLFAACYFIYQSLTGDLKIQNRSENKAKLSRLIEKYETNNADISYFEKRIKALDPKTLDADVLDEEMRKKMLFSKKNEIILLTPEE